MPLVLSAHGFELDFEVLYARLWELAYEEDGARVYASVGDQALKWLIADIAGTPAVSGRTLPANDSLREQVHEQLLAAGRAERITQRRFRLLTPPTNPPQGFAAAEPEAPVGVELGGAEEAQDAEDEGSAIAGVEVGAVVGGDGRLRLGGLAWSRWTSLPDAAAEATKRPGVYAARCEGQLVYVGMAGERRGQGVRGRLRVYARGRGAVSGLGEALLDRALADPAWVRERLALLETGAAERATGWARAALTRRPLEVAWAACPSVTQARLVERAMLVELEDADLWNRARPRTQR